MTSPNIWNKGRARAADYAPIGPLHGQKLARRVVEIVRDPVGPEAPLSPQSTGAGRGGEGGRVHPRRGAFEPAPIVEALVGDAVGRALRRHRLAHRVAAAVIGEVDPGQHGQGAARRVGQSARLDAHRLVVRIAIGEFLRQAEAAGRAGADLPGLAAVDVVAEIGRVVASGQRSVHRQRPAGVVVGIIGVERHPLRRVDPALALDEEGVAPIEIFGADLVRRAAGGAEAAEKFVPVPVFRRGNQEI